MTFGFTRLEKAAIAFDQSKNINEDVTTRVKLDEAIGTHGMDGIGKNYYNRRILRKISISGTFWKYEARVLSSLIFVVATLDTLYVYDTEGVEPIVFVADIHRAAITDIAWSHSENYLVVSSEDGYLSIVEFENIELGTSSPLAEENSPEDEWLKINVKDKLKSRAKAVGKMVANSIVQYVTKCLYINLREGLG